MGLFQLTKPGDTVFDNRNSSRTVSLNLKLETIHTRMVKNVDKDICSQLEPGEAYFILTNSKINMRTFLYWILKNTGNYIDELTISTYSVSTSTIEMLRGLILKNMLGKITLIVFSHFLRLQDPKYFHIRNICQDNGIKLIFRDNHSKIMLARSGRRRIVLFGSGNFGENSLIEEYFLIDDGRIFDFYREGLLED